MLNLNSFPRLRDVTPFLVQCICAVANKADIWALPTISGILLLLLLLIIIIIIIIIIINIITIIIININIIIIIILFI